jgi:hypothetical protein
MLFSAHSWDSSILLGLTGIVGRYLGLRVPFSDLNCPRSRDNSYRNRGIEHGKTRIEAGECEIAELGLPFLRTRRSSRSRNPSAHWSGDNAERGEELGIALESSVIICPTRPLPRLSRPRLSILGCRFRV